MTDVDLLDQKIEWLADQVGGSLRALVVGSWVEDSSDLPPSRSSSRRVSG
jgi:hypothetical protein